MPSCPTTRQPVRRRPPLLGLAVLFSPLLALTLPAPGSAVPILPDGHLEVDGKPFFPVGLVELGTYRYADWNDRIRRSGANVIWDIEIAYADTMPTCEAVVDSAAAINGGLDGVGEQVKRFEIQAGPDLFNGFT